MRLEHKHCCWLVLMSNCRCIFGYQLLQWLMMKSLLPFLSGHPSPSLWRRSLVSAFQDMGNQVCVTCGASQVLSGVCVLLLSDTGFLEEQHSP